MHYLTPLPLSCPRAFLLISTLISTHTQASFPRRFAAVVLLVPLFRLPSDTYVLHNAYVHLRAHPVHVCMCERK